MSTWEERMAERADARRPADPESDIPTVLAGDLPPGASDKSPRDWCSICGLPAAKALDCPRLALLVAGVPAMWIHMALVWTPCRP